MRHARNDVPNRTALDLASTLIVVCALSGCGTAGDPVGPQTPCVGDATPSPTGPTSEAPAPHPGASTTDGGDAGAAEPEAADGSEPGVGAFKPWAMAAGDARLEPSLTHDAVVVVRPGASITLELLASFQAASSSYRVVTALRPVTNPGSGAPWETSRWAVGVNPTTPNPLSIVSGGAVSIYVDVGCPSGAESEEVDLVVSLVREGASTGTPRSVVLRFAKKAM
jgi:hypothetical protein